jgi:DNA-binding LacI/PurR family transcriptional regulator
MDVTIATFDESYSIGLYSKPPIIVYQNPKTIGALAAEQLYKQIEEHISPKQIVVDERILDPADSASYYNFLAGS